MTITIVMQTGCRMKWEIIHKDRSESWSRFEVGNVLKRKRALSGKPYGFRRENRLLEPHIQRNQYKIQHDKLTLDNISQLSLSFFFSHFYNQSTDYTELLHDSKLLQSSNFGYLVSINTFRFADAQKYWQFWIYSKLLLNIGGSEQVMDSYDTLSLPPPPFILSLASHIATIPQNSRMKTNEEQNFILL